MWLPWRRMPLIAIILLIIGVALAALLEDFIPAVDKVFPLVIMGLLGIAANRIYFLHARRKIRPLVALPVDQALLRLRAIGGTNSWSAVLFFIVLAGAAAYSRYEERVLSTATTPPPQQPYIGSPKNTQQLQRELQQKYDALVRDVERRYPDLNPDSRRYNQALADMVMARKATYEKQGLDSVSALQRVLEEMNRR
jgi:hypothetical protein